MKSSVNKIEFLRMVNARMQEHWECEGVRLESWEPDGGHAHFSGPQGQACVNTVGRIIGEILEEYVVQG